MSFLSSKPAASSADTAARKQQVMDEVKQQLGEPFLTPNGLSAR